MAWKDNFRKGLLIEYPQEKLCYPHNYKHKKPLTFCDKYIDKAIEQYYRPQTYPPNKWNIPLYQRLKHHLLRK